jgi:hypothetical protein
MRVFSIISILQGRPYFQDLHPPILGTFLLLQFPLTVLGGYLLLRGRRVGGALLLASAVAFVPCWIILTQPFLGEPPFVVPAGQSWLESSGQLLRSSARDDDIQGPARATAKPTTCSRVILSLRKSAPSTKTKTG